MENVKTLIIQDNNPDLLLFLAAIIAVVLIVVNLIGIYMKKKRKQRLEETKQKIIKRHEQLEIEFSRKEAEQNAKKNSSYHNPY